MKSKFKVKDVLFIKWLDSTHTSGWRFPSELEFTIRHLEHETVGFLFKETEYSVSVIQSRHVDDVAIDALMEIPKVAILDIIKLDWPAKKTRKTNQ